MVPRDDAVLLGKRQLKFLRQWGADWHDCEMKAVLSQTIFCGGAHIHGKLGVRAGSTGWVAFENVEVPVENRLGEEGEGFKIAMSCLDNGPIPRHSLKRKI